MASTDSKTKPTYVIRSGLGSRSKSVMSASKRKDRIVTIVADGKVKKSMMGSSTKSLKQLDETKEIEARDEAKDLLNDYELDEEKIIEMTDDMHTNEREANVDEQNQSTAVAPIGSSYTSMDTPFTCVTTLMDDIEAGTDIVLGELFSFFSDKKSDDTTSSSTYFPNVSTNSNESHKFKSNAVNYSAKQFKKIATKKIDIAAIESSCVSYKGIGSTATSMYIKKSSDDLVPRQNQVLVQIEASTVTTMDSEIRSGLLKIDKNFFGDLEIIPGSAFVGCVQWKGESVVNTHIKERVASFCPQGGANSEFVKTEDASLVPVPEKVSSLCAAICVGAYLPVFQALNIGMPREYRYNSEAKSLYGKAVVYFTDPTSSFVEPLVRLAKCLGARDVYIPLGAAESSEISAHLNSIGAIPFNPEEKSFESGIDILINDASMPITETIRSALTDTGFMVTIQKNNTKQHESSSASQYHYNVADSWNSNLEESKKDLIFLFDLVKKKYLLPKLARTLRLSEVPEGHACLDAKVPIRGTFICLPWHKGF